MTDLERYHAACHAMQSGVAMEMNYLPEPTQPKHLRVGVNSALCDNSALALLLVAKGVITLDEYHKALADQMEAEVYSYENRLAERIGSRVHLV
jgi:hypothetical protein